MDADRRRLYHLGDYLRAGAVVLRELPALRAARRAGRISPAFVHKLQLVVSEVNDCRACSYQHAAQMLTSGASEGEIGQLLAGSLDHFPPEEAVALVFAQHYAESGGRPDPGALARLQDYYGATVGRDILSYLRLVQWGSMGGNILDAFARRMRGAPVAGSSLRDELPVVLAIGPLYLPRLAWRDRSRRFTPVRRALRHGREARRNATKQPYANTPDTP